MTASLPAEVEAVLRENGWDPDRDGAPAAAAAAAIRAMVAQVGANGARHEPFPAAHAALTQFGGTFVLQDGAGVDLRRRPFALDPTMAAHSAETLADLGRVLGNRLFPIGVEGDAEAVLAIDEQGRVFAVDAYGEWFLGANMVEALTTLVTGRQPVRVGDGGTWPDVDSPPNRAANRTPASRTTPDAVQSMPAPLAGTSTEARAHLDLPGSGHGASSPPRESRESAAAKGGHADPTGNALQVLRSVREESADRVVAALRAVSLEGVQQPVAAAVLAELGYALKARYLGAPRHRRNVRDLDESIACYEQALGLDTHPGGRVNLLTNLTQALQACCLERPGPPAAEAAVAAAGQAVHEAATENSLLVDALTMAESVVRTMPGIEGVPEPRLAALAAAAARGMAGMSAGSPQEAPCALLHAQLVHALRQRSGLDPLDQALSAWARAALTMRSGDQMRRNAYYGAGELALERYARRRNPRDLDVAVSALRGAVRELSHSADSGGVGDVGLLGWALRQRIDLASDPAHVTGSQPEEPLDEQLDEAIGCFRLVLESGRGEERDTAVEQLCDLLVLRFRRGGNSADLDECLAFFWAHAVETGPPAGRSDAPGAFAAAQAVKLKTRTGGEPVNPAVLSLLRGHRLRPSQTGPGSRMKSVFNEPYTVIAARRRSEDWQELPARDLAAQGRGRQRPDWELAAELDEVIPQLRALLQDNEDPDLLADLADALMARHIAVPTDEVLDELIGTLRRKIASLPPFEAIHSKISLAVALQARLLHKGRMEDAEEATALLDRAMAVPGQLTHDLLGLAPLRGNIAAATGNWEGAAAAYRTAISLLPRLATQHLSSADHTREMSRVAGLANDASAAAVRAGDPAQALELVEQGRGLLIGRALDLRDELDRLPPELAGHLRRIARGLSAGVGDGSLLAGAGINDSAVDRRRDLAREWGRTVQRIRSLPGLERFLEPLTAARLARAAQAGPVVVLVDSMHGSHALVVTPSGVQAVDLPALTPEAVANQVRLFLRALTFAGLSVDEEESIEAQEPLREVLAWLWDAVAQPVLDRLGSPQRMWWVPTGNLSYLPLHAAGRDNECVLDRVVSSYTPTVRSLLASREHPPGRHDMQIVAVAEAPRLPPLPGVTAEADRLAQFFPGARELRNAAATPQAVLEGLADASWVHFACHATNDADPTRSYLSVHDGEVSVADVLASRSSTGNSPKGELAYLSACQTAASAPEAHVPDEVIHLGSAFQVGGFRHVVGTLWSVSDSTAAQTARLFYSGLGTPASADRAPFALHHAVQEVRRRYPLLPTRWAPYIHLGP